METISGATVLCVDDYMKPFLKNPPDHFILQFRTNDMSSKNLPLIDNSRKIKAKHLNKFKLHLTKYGSRVFRSIIYLKFSIDNLKQVIQTLMLNSAILSVILLPKNTMSES